MTITNCRDLIVMTPIVQGSDRNVIRVERFRQNEEVPGNILHVAGGQHTGIIVRRLIPTDVENEINAKRSLPSEISLDFTVWLKSTDSEAPKQESRQLRFWFYEDVHYDEKHRTAQQFFKGLVMAFPKDYISFIKLVMKLIQGGFEALSKVEIDMRLVHESEATRMPESKEYGESGSEVESVTIAHVQDVLEHAYPNGLTVETIAEALRCTIEETTEFLRQLEAKNIARELPDSGEWIRIEESTEQHTTVVRQMPRSTGADQPTVAIVSALFIEKQAVDAMIDNKQILHRYKSDGESNVYTLGTIGRHRVVATKLPAMGNSLQAKTSAGSITTRLLGNFQHVQHVLVVGVGGGVAHYTDKDRHVRLGDVVVSTPTAQFPHAYVHCDKLLRDRETERVCGFGVRKWTPKDSAIVDLLQSTFGPQSNGVSNGSNGEGGHAKIEPWQPFVNEAVDYLNGVVGSSEYSFSRPSTDSDVLTLPVGDGHMVTVPHPNKDRSESKIHYGPIGSGGGDQLRKTPTLHDEFSAEYGLRAFVAEFDSVIEGVFGSRIDSWALVRGIADYSNGMRNREWQAHAALQAAAFAKALIMQLPLEEA